MKASEMRHIGLQVRQPSASGRADGVLFLDEPMTWHKIVGIAAAVIGVVLISF